MDRVAIALGSNLGDRRAQLDGAVARLSPYFSSITVSSYYDTEPVDVPGPQDPFLNAAVVVETNDSVYDVFEILTSIEAEAGRERPYPGAPRTLDLDLILFGDLVLDDPALTVPHPRFRERQFVLDPLAEIAGDLVDPVTGQTVAELRLALAHRRR